jgi:hypothetical protein
MNQEGELLAEVPARFILHSRNERVCHAADLRKALAAHPRVASHRHMLAAVLWLLESVNCAQSFWQPYLCTPPNPLARVRTRVRSTSMFFLDLFIISILINIFIYFISAELPDAVATVDRWDQEELAEVGHTLMLYEMVEYKKKKIAADYAAILLPFLQVTHPPLRTCGTPRHATRGTTRSVCGWLSSGTFARAQENTQLFGGSIPSEEEYRRALSLVYSRTFDFSELIGEHVFIPFVVLAHTAHAPPHTHKHIAHAPPHTHAHALTALVAFFTTTNTTGFSQPLDQRHGQGGVHLQLQPRQGLLRTPGRR